MKKLYLLSLCLFFSGVTLLSSERNRVIYQLPSDAILQDRLFGPETSIFWNRSNQRLATFITDSHLIENIKKVPMHPSEVSSLIELAYYDYIKSVLNFKNLEASPVDLVSWLPAVSDQNKRFAIDEVRWILSQINRLYESFLQDYPSELLRLEDLGLYNQFHEIADYL